MSNILFENLFISVGIDVGADFSWTRFGLTYAENKYNAIIQAANDANTFGYSVSSNLKVPAFYQP